MKRKTVRIVFGTVALLIIIFLLVWTQKPKVQKIQLGQTIEQDLDFIAQNLLSGGPPKDGIPAIDNPIYVTAQEADVFVEDDEIVFGINFKGKIIAYPSSILYWHEIVNDEIDGQKISIAWCPLTGTTLGFLNKNLGVSGKLFNSNLVMYDRGTDSYIPQILHTAVTGPLKGQKLEQFPVVGTTWMLWKQQYPNTLVLSRNTGFSRDYDRNPYPGYEDILRVWFPLTAESDRFHSKKIVHGIELNGEYLAIPKAEFRTKKQASVTLGGDIVQIIYNKDLDSIETYKNQITPENRLPSFDTYWFAWYAYHPNTEVLE